MLALFTKDYLAFICYDSAFFGGCINYVISMSVMTSVTVRAKMRKWSVRRFYKSIFFEWAIKHLLHHVFNF